MTAVDSDFALVGRDATASLLDLLVRARKPLPVVVVFGPGGSGKTKLCEHVETRWRNLAPIATVTIDDAGAKTCRDILTRAANELQRYSSKQFGRLAMPRFELAGRLLAEPAPKGTRDRERRARQLLGGGGLVVTQDPAVGGSWLGSLAGILITAITQVRAPLIAAPVGLRWLRRLFMPRIAGALRWYEKRAPGFDPHGLPQAGDAAVVASRVWDSVWDPDERPDQARRITADRLLVAAFLADLDHAYRRRRRFRKLNCVLLLDGADLLSTDQPNRLNARPGQADTTENDVLTLLAEGKLNQPEVPLLVIATKQARPDLPDGLSDAEVGPGDDPTQVARDRYRRWRERLPHGGPAAAYLPVVLDPFTPTQTRQFLAEWSRLRERTSRRETLAEEMHAVTHGHPLAMVLVADALAEGLRLYRTTPVVRTTLTDPWYGGDSPHTIRHQLVQRFLQRFPDDESADRRYHRQLLARLAAPRRLHLDLLGEVMPELAPDLDAGTTWRRLATYSFMRTDPTDSTSLIMHPLLRDLLIAELRDGEAGPGPDYARTHQLFLELFSRRRKHWPADVHEVAYHALALGDRGPLAATVEEFTRAPREGWTALVEQLARAPQPADPAEETTIGHATAPPAPGPAEAVPARRRRRAERQLAVVDDPADRPAEQPAERHGGGAR